MEDTKQPRDGRAPGCDTILLGVLFGLTERTERERIIYCCMSLDFPSPSAEKRVPITGEESHHVRRKDKAVVFLFERDKEREGGEDLLGSIYHTRIQRPGPPAFFYATKTPRRDKKETHAAGLCYFSRAKTLRGGDGFSGRKGCSTAERRGRGSTADKKPNAAAALILARGKRPRVAPAEGQMVPCRLGQVLIIVV